MGTTNNIVNRSPHNLPIRADNAIFAAGFRAITKKHEGECENKRGYLGNKGNYLTAYGRSFLFEEGVRLKVDVTAQTSTGLYTSILFQF
jgi:hypothetical protein